MTDRDAEESANINRRSILKRNRNYGTANNDVVVEEQEDDATAELNLDCTGSSPPPGSPAFLINEAKRRQCNRRADKTENRKTVNSTATDRNAMQQQNSKDNRSALLICMFCLAISYNLTIVFLSLCSSISRRSRFQSLVSLITAFCVPVMIWASVFLSSSTDGVEMFYGLPAVVFSLCVVYMCLKFPPRFDLAFCLTISVGHLFLMCWMPRRQRSTTKFVPEVLVIVLSLAAANIVGYFHSYFVTTSRRKAYEQFNDAVIKRTHVEYEKERQEQLLLSIIPVYLAAKVRKTILNRTSKTRESIDYSSEPPKMFQDLHVQQHENVSILFADIVNFTPLTAELTAAELVRFLNELYSRFDSLAQDFQCMRIKILGDCYYCVSGMPVSRPNHADNCVKMGLAMIDAIKVLKEVSSVNMDMRIGIHSGSVLCGLLGLKKWQYDIWSDDVTLANRMESCGSPGKLHITKATLQLLSGYYKVEAACSTDPYFQSHGIETFFIVPTSSAKLTSTHSAFELKTNATNGLLETIGEDDKFERTKSFTNKQFHSTAHNSTALSKTTSKMTKMVEFWGAETPFSNLTRRRSSDRIRSASINLISNSFETQKLKRLRGCCFSSEQATADFDIFLRNQSKSTPSSETGFTSHVPVSSNVVISIAIIGSIFLASIDLIVSRTALQPIFSGIGFAILIFLLILTLAQYIKENVQSNVSSRVLIMEKLHLSNSLISILVLTLAVFLAVAPFFNLSTCQLFLIILSIMFYLGFVVKCLVVVIALIVFYAAIFVSGKPQTSGYDNSTALVLNATSSNNNDVYFDFRSVFNLLLLALIVVLVMWLKHERAINYRLNIVRPTRACRLVPYFYDLQVEYECKMYWACLATFRGEQDDVETMQNINTILLQNILPDHVAAYFLQPDRNPSTLYHENHDSVCVMFASIPNFKDFWSEWDFTRKLECLRLLNEIICDFDKLLSKPKFSNIEKIKTVASTYMCAAGLHPSQAGQQDPKKFAAIMVDFAFAITALLEQLNKDSFQNFQLRIGISFGPVIAGVVGAQKPQYDIFGNTVNLASRMDSHGEMGRIHVTPETAVALVAMGYDVESRGLIKVKGVKHELETFFVLPTGDRKTTAIIG